MVLAEPKGTACNYTTPLQEIHEDMGLVIKIEDNEIDEKVTITSDGTNQSTTPQFVNKPSSNAVHKLTIPLKRKLSNENPVVGLKATRPTKAQFMAKKNKQKKKSKSQRGAGHHRKAFQGLRTAVPFSLPAKYSAISSNNSSVFVSNLTKSARKMSVPGNNSSDIVNKTSLVVDTTQVTVNKEQRHPTDAIGSIDMGHTKHAVSSTIINLPVPTQSDPIRVGILADPPKSLTKNDVKRIKNFVKDKILENVGQKDGFAPHFIGKPQIFNGVLSVLCQDVETYNWLCHTIPNLPALQAGRKLIVRLLSGMPGYVKVGVLLPDCQEGLEEAQQILSHCNPWAQVNSWFLVNANRQKEKIYLTLNIPVNVVPTVLEKGSRLSYLLGSVYIRFFGPNGKLYTTPPIDKMKEIERYLENEKNQQLIQNKGSIFENCRSSEQILPDKTFENNNTSHDDQQNSSNSDVHNPIDWSARHGSRDGSPFDDISRRNAERSISDIDKGKDRPTSRDRSCQRLSESNRQEYDRRDYESHYKSNERYGDKRYQSRYVCEDRDQYEHGNRHESMYNDRCEERPQENNRASHDIPPRYEHDYQSGHNTSNESVHWSDYDGSDFQIPSAHVDERAESHGYKQWCNYSNDNHIASSDDRNRPEGSTWKSSNHHVYQDKSFDYSIPGPSKIETIVNAYKTLAKIPSVVGAKLNNAGNKVNVKWSVRNLDKGKSTKYSNNYILDSDFKVIAQSDFGTDISNELLSAVSPKETYKALIREEKNGKDVKKQYLEVWNKTSLQHCIDLTALDLHGDVYADSEFGSLDWSQDESAIVYVAEKKKPKSEPYIKRKGEDKASNDGSGEPAPKKGEEFLYRQDWGEQLEGKFCSVVVVCRLPAETVSVLDHLPDGCCAGQVRFSPDGGSVVGVAWETEPRRLGLIFCTNRPGYIFSLTLDGSLKKVSKPGVAVRSPRYRPNGDLVWLQRVADGPHHACHQLVMKTDGQDEVTTLIDIVQTEKQIANGVFYGLYCLGLPNECFTTDGSRVVFSTPQETQVRTYVFDIDNRTITDISNKQTPGSTSVLDIKNDVIVSTFTNLTTPGQIFITRLPAKRSEASVEWVRVSDPVDVPAPVAKATVNYMKLNHDNDDDVKSFTALHLMPEVAVDKKIPLVVWPHGGPHSAFADAYSVEAALFAILGFSSVQINYRGSIGAGQSSVYYLPNRVGDADVIDCKMAADNIIQNYPINEKNVFLTGGSHGGFLVTHLSGQYPDMFCAVVTRNPVTDVAAMFNYTDINDWCAVEAGFEFTEKGPISEEQLLAMRRCSPIAHVHKVRAPTALMLGSGDKRVPHYQGLEYARRLKANGVETRVYMYEDNHSLSSLPAEMDNLINGAHWFLTHLNN